MPPSVHAQRAARRRRALAACLGSWFGCWAGLASAWHLSLAVDAVWRCLRQVSRSVQVQRRPRCTTTRQTDLCGGTRRGPAGCSCGGLGSRMDADAWRGMYGPPRLCWGIYRHPLRAPFPAVDLTFAGDQTRPKILSLFFAGSERDVGSADTRGAVEATEKLASARAHRHPGCISHA